MKKLSSIILIFSVILLPIGCGTPDMMKDTIESMLAQFTANYTIEIGCTECLNFSGE